MEKIQTHDSTMEFTTVRLFPVKVLPNPSGCFSSLYCDVKRSGFLNCRATASSHMIRSAVNSRGNGSPGHNWTPWNKFAGSHLDVDKKFKDLNLVFFFYGLIEETF